jgi:hypothetical protein
MATRFYIVNSSVNQGTLGIGEKSSAKTDGGSDVLPAKTVDLHPVAGSAEVNTNRQAKTTADINLFFGRCISPPVGKVPQINAQTLTFALETLESSTNMNAFWRPTVYVVDQNDNVRGFIYDGTANMGSEFPTARSGAVFTVAGAAVTGLQPTDKLVVEVWAGGKPSKANPATTATLYFSGTKDVANGANNSPAASYVEFAQDGLIPTANDLVAIL